jgi:hypothetical protein
MPAKFIVILFIGTFITLKSLNAQVADEGPIPAAFTCQGILIVEKPQSKNTVPGYENHIKKEFEKNYKGKYVLATKKDIETNSQYLDKKIYRFILHLKWIQVLGDPNLKQELIFYLEDRETNTTYNGIGENSNKPVTYKLLVKMLNGNCK